MAILRKKNVFELQVPMKYVTGVEVVDARQDLFDIEVSDIDGKAIRFLNFIPEVAGIDRLIGMQ